jgi:hypothetical protein
VRSASSSVSSLLLSGLCSKRGIRTLKAIPAKLRPEAIRRRCMRRREPKGDAKLRKVFVFYLTTAAALHRIFEEYAKLPSHSHARSDQRSITMSPVGREQQISTLPSAGGSTGSGR